jgi:DNA-binding transcriptional regulator YiaG
MPHPRKLTAHQVQQIRQEAGATMKTVLARRFNVSHETIRRVQKGVVYKLVPDIREHI